MSGHPMDLDRLELFAAGRLSGADEDDVRRHLESCEDCGSWVETYSLLGDALQPESGTAGHPTSEQLARLAVDPDGLAPLERERIESHLGACLSCRREGRLTTEAVAEARRPENDTADSRQGVATPLRFAIAASLVLALGLGWLLQRSPVETTAAVDHQRTLTGVSLEGTRIIESDGMLTADSVEVARGGDITLRAADVVVFGDGFSVGKGATLRVEISAPDDRDSDTT